jgi:hypothetical protein
MSEGQSITSLTNLREAVVVDESFTSGKVLLSPSASSKGRHGILFIAKRD